LMKRINDHLSQYHSEPVSHLLGVKVGVALSQTCRTLIEQIVEEDALSRLADYVVLATDESLCKVAAQATTDELAALMKVLPIGRAGVLASRVPGQRFTNATTGLQRRLPK